MTLPLETDLDAAVTGDDFNLRRATRESTTALRNTGQPASDRPEQRSRTVFERRSQQP